MMIKRVGSLLVFTFLLVAVASISAIEAKSLQPANADMESELLSQEGANIEAESLPAAYEDIEEQWAPPTTSDVCWRDSESGTVVRLRFSNAGGGYYRIVGKLTSEGSIGGIFGSSVTTTSYLYATLTGSSSTSSNTNMVTVRATVNRSTSRMTVYLSGLRHYNNSTNPNSVSPFFDGPNTMSKITCPQ